MLKDTYFNQVLSCADENQDLSNVLGALCFYENSEASAMPDLSGCPTTNLHVPMRCLGGEQILSEVFQANCIVKEGKLGAVRYRCSDSLIFGVLSIPEADFQSDTDIPPLQAASRAAYAQIFAVLKAEGFPSILRFWNYMARINEHSHGLERYRQFNQGRQEAFDANEQLVCASIPAACALGSRDGPLTIAFMAGRIESLAIENPRQISAYDYPPQYGPRSPLFSRASLAEIEGSEVLFLSGTASIVGHETLHANDVVGQTRETVANIRAVLAEANKSSRNNTFDLSSLNYKVYVRSAEDFPLICQELMQAVGPTLKAVYVQADICRTDLLVEIEGTSAFGYQLF